MKQARLNKENQIPNQPLHSAQQLNYPLSSMPDTKPEFSIVDFLGMTLLWVSVIVALIGLVFITIGLSIQFDLNTLLSIGIGFLSQFIFLFYLRKKLNE